MHAAQSTWNIIVENKQNTQGGWVIHIAANMSLSWERHENHYNQNYIATDHVLVLNET